MRQEESNEVDKQDPDRVETALSRSFSKSETHLVGIEIENMGCNENSNGGVLRIFIRLLFHGVLLQWSDR